MALIALPDGGTAVNFSAAGLRRVRADKAIEFFNGASQITVGLKDAWAGSFKLPKMEKGDISRAWEMAICELAELANDFEIAPFGITGTSTAYAGADPQVDGAAQTGKTLNLKGATVSITIAKRGDWFSFLDAAAVDRQLCRLTADLVTDPSGDASAAFLPAIRKSPGDSVAIQLKAPLGRFMFAEPIASWDIDLLLRTGFSVVAVESFGP